MPYASQILPCTPADSRTDDVPFDRAEEGLARAGGCSLRCLADGGGVLLRRKVRREGEVRETPASGFPQISFSPLCCVAWQNSSPLGPPASELTVVEPPNRARREKLFKHINSLPTVYEILSGKAVNKHKAKAKGAAAGQVPPLFPQFPHCQRCAFPGGGAGTLVARLRCRRDLFEPSAAASMSTKGVQNPNSSRSSLEHTAAPAHDRRLRLPSLRCA